MCYVDNTTRGDTGDDAIKVPQPAVQVTRPQASGQGAPSSSKQKKKGKSQAKAPPQQFVPYATATAPSDVQSILSAVKKDVTRDHTPWWMEVQIPNWMGGGISEEAASSCIQSISPKGDGVHPVVAELDTATSSTRGCQDCGVRADDGSAECVTL